MMFPGILLVLFASCQLSLGYYESMAHQSNDFAITLDMSVSFEHHIVTTNDTESVTVEFKEGSATTNDILYFGINYKYTWVQLKTHYGGVTQASEHSGFPIAVQTDDRVDKFTFTFRANSIIVSYNDALYHDFSYRNGQTYADIGRVRSTTYPIGTPTKRRTMKYTWPGQTLVVEDTLSVQWRAHSANERLTIAFFEGDAQCVLSMTVRYDTAEIILNTHTTTDAWQTPQTSSWTPGPGSWELVDFIFAFFSDRIAIYIDNVCFADFAYRNGLTFANIREMRLSSLEESAVRDIGKQRWDTLSGLSCPTTTTPAAPTPSQPPPATDSNLFALVPSGQAKTGNILGTVPSCRSAVECAVTCVGTNLCQKFAYKDITRDCRLYDDGLSGAALTDGIWYEKV